MSRQPLWVSTALSFNTNAYTVRWGYCGPSRWPRFREWLGNNLVHLGYRIKPKTKEQLGWVQVTTGVGRARQEGR